MDSIAGAWVNGGLLRKHGSVLFNPFLGGLLGAKLSLFRIQNPLAISLDVAHLLGHSHGEVDLFIVETHADFKAVLGLAAPANGGLSAEGRLAMFDCDVNTLFRWHKGR